MISLPGFVVVGLLVVSANLAAGHEYGRLGPAWEQRRNEMTNGKDILDWSRDPRRVDPKVYNQYEQKETSHRYSWTYAFTGQLEGQEYPSGLLKGKRIEPKSKGQAAICGRDDWGLAILNTDPPDRMGERYIEYMETNGFLYVREFPSSPTKDDICPMVTDHCTTYHLKERGKPDRLIGSLSEGLGGAVEGILRDYGPVMFVTDLNVQGNDIDENGFLARCGSEWDGDTQHNILLVGYGITDDGEKYFKYKNSLGPRWGHNGYGYIKYGKSRSWRGCKPRGSIVLWEIEKCEGGRARGSRRQRKHG